MHFRPLEKVKLNFKSYLLKIKFKLNLNDFNKNKSV